METTTQITLNKLVDKSGKPITIRIPNSKLEQYNKLRAAAFEAGENLRKAIDASEKE